MLIIKLLSLGILCRFAYADVYWYDKTQTLASRQTIVHLFEWKWTDIAKECENFLQHYGYGAVQVSPPNEHITMNVNNDMPWWVRYQPVSYKLSSRSGTQAEFTDMINRCNKVGVRIVVDVVMNHMVGVGQKKNVDGKGSSGSSDYDGSDGVEKFPGVPYTSADFNDFRCHGDIQPSDYNNNANNVKNCRLSGLLDLNQGATNVRNQLIELFFMCDASKHMWPADLKAILDGTKNLRADIFGSNQRPFAVHEVIDQGGEAVKCNDYITIGRYTNFNFGAAVSQAAKGQSDWKNLAMLGPGYQYGNDEDHDVLNFIDNHDNQRSEPPAVVTYKNGNQYTLAVAFMLAWPYGYTRVMSSYAFNAHDQGPPNSGAGSGFATTSPKFNADDTCDTSAGWVCEHRQPTIRQMATFRSAVQGSAAGEIITDFQRIAFARVDKGFFALNGNSNTWNNLKNGACTGTTITVRDDGTASLAVASKSAIAFSLASKVGGSPAPSPIPSSWTKTVVFLRKDTNPGENLFIRGGATQHGSCSSGPNQQTTDPCAIPMRHNTTVPFVFNEYLSWSQEDNYLDFEGSEEKQGTHDGQPAFGTPLAYSTNDKTAIEYQPYNKYGPGYWMVQIYMDCSKAENQWFELKGYSTPSVGWEGNVNQGSCGGAVGGKAPFTSINHIAKCGAVNVFVFGSNTCTIDNI